MPRMFTMIAILRFKPLMQCGVYLRVGRNECNLSTPGNRPIGDGQLSTGRHQFRQAGHVSAVYLNRVGPVATAERFCLIFEMAANAFNLAGIAVSRRDRQHTAIAFWGKGVECSIEIKAHYWPASPRDLRLSLRAGALHFRFVCPMVVTGVISRLHALSA